MLVMLWKHYLVNKTKIMLKALDLLCVFYQLKTKTLWIDLAKIMVSVNWLIVTPGTKHHCIKEINHVMQSKSDVVSISCPLSRYQWRRDAWFANPSLIIEMLNDDRIIVDHVVIRQTGSFKQTPKKSKTNKARKLATPSFNATMDRSFNMVS